MCVRISVRVYAKKELRARESMARSDKFFLEGLDRFVEFDRRRTIDCGSRDAIFRIFLLTFSFGLWNGISQLPL